MKPGQKVLYKGKQYDYGYKSIGKGECVIYEENGHHSMQDAILVNLSDLTLVNDNDASIYYIDKSEVAAAAYKALQRGDPIKDRDLLVAIDVFTDMVETTNLMGRRFDLFASELQTVLTTLIGFRDFRRKDV